MARTRCHVASGRGTDVTVNCRDWERGEQGQVIAGDTMTVGMPFQLHCTFALSVQGCRERLVNARKISYST